ncbi:MAG: lipopolysaccharide heptosyltransferase II [Kiritimatiellaeota bacterium]|nr:lipopolysaccharide heptosyltransferase II [Kiritimatiellota bacterium]
MGVPNGGMDFGNTPSFPVVELELRDWRDGIIVRAPNWLGDAMMAVPALFQLSKTVPDNCGFFVVSPLALAELFESLDFVDVVHPLSRLHAAWSRCDKTRISRLRAGVGLLLNNSLRDAYHFKMAGVPKLFGAAARGRSIFLTKAFNFPKIKKGALNQAHHAGRYLAMAQTLGAPEWDGSLPEFNISYEPETMSDSTRSALDSDNLLVLAPSAAYGEAKRWPTSYFRTVAEKWIAKDGEVAVIGAPAEKPIANDLVRGLRPEKTFNLAAETSLTELSLVLRHAKWCVANDSGVMHLSAVLGGEGVAIFGSTDPTSTSPVSKKWKILHERQPCAPCFKRACPFGHYDCLKKITPDKVLEIIF